jgi:cysteinyl-tRNA synthetase
MAAADKWELWQGSTKLRGAVLHPCRLFEVDKCNDPVTLQDVRDLAALGANLINASYPGLFKVEPPYEIDQDAVDYLDNLIAWAEQAQLYVVIHFRTGPGRNESSIHLLSDSDTSVWSEQLAQDAWVRMWEFTAERYRNSPVVVGYNLMVEPHPNVLVDPDFELDPKEVQSTLQGSLMDWNQLSQRLANSIREVDPDTPIIINSINWASSEWFSVLEPVDLERVVYSLHAYDPDAYTTQEQGEDSIRYPDEVRDGGETIIFNRSWLADGFRPALEFAQTHDVPIFVGEFGAMRWVPNAADFVSDQISLFEEHGWNYTYYVWRGDEPFFDGFNMEIGPDPDSHSQDLDNEVLGVHLERWSENEYFPGLNTASSASIASVERWLYLIDVNLDDEVIDQITDSEFDMVVIDYIPSEENNTDFPIEDVVAEWHAGDHPKLVIAYIDIGEAEDYRTYWQPGWGIGNPEWIAGGDPDGWEGNFPVAYWYDGWRQVWLGGSGIMEGILDAGFDGIYLDWVEAYSDENVMRIAENDGVDPVQEMIYWVSDLGEFGRSRNSEFLVIGQNAAELAAFDDYVEAIDAIAQEQVWFDGGADNDPQGDCPLPRSEEDIDSEEYRESLSPECQRQYDEFPESTLHVSTQGYVQDLLFAKERGLTIFTVDYALLPENVQWVYETSRQLGFIPFVSNRALDQYVQPYP